MHALTQDYRCSCGKLLLRGLIINGLVEIKCRYCKHVSAISGLGGSALGNERYVFVSDAGGRVVRHSTNAPLILRPDERQVVGAHVSDFFPTLETSRYVSVWNTLIHEKKPVLFLQIRQNISSQESEAVWLEVRRLELSGDPYLVFVITRQTSLEVMI